MNNTFFKTGFSSSLPDLIEVADGSTPMPFNPYGLWLFGGDSSSLTSTISSAELTTVALPTYITVNEPFTYNPKSINLVSYVDYYLDVDIPDGEDVSVVGIAKQNIEKEHMLFGNLHEGIATDKSNWGVYVSGKNLVAAVNPIGEGRERTLTLAANITTDSVFSYGVSFNGAKNTITLTCINDGEIYRDSMTFDNNYVGDGVGLALGNRAYFKGMSRQGVDHMHLTMYKKALTQDNLLTSQLYALDIELSR